MVVGILKIRLHLPGSNSLKAKRKIIMSMKERIKSKFNVSVAELEDNDLWQVCTLGVAVISNDSAFANTVLSNVANMAGNHPEAVVTDINLEWR
ncbi:MAG: DUF503 domain-containing protein [candidate division Zixibacteria bacterium]|nr:DUF503 domain-containing protein [candidate division Zixibacteria bacterium]